MTVTLPAATNIPLEGQVLQVRICGPTCPCWAREFRGESPCADFLTIHHIERGRMQGVDLSGVTMINLVHVGAIFLDDTASAEQRAAILSTLVPVIEDDVEVRSARIDYHIRDSRGLVTVGDMLVVRVQPSELEGVRLDLNLPGLRLGRASAVPAIASVSMRHLPVSRVNWELTGRNAIHATFTVDMPRPPRQGHSPRARHHR
ncbi:DUF1326 domain-containing protein [Nitrolancea hollandica]|uniref:DUF1326 domain-containing protein n=1 Tax=Nitrolancea hollandica Lb TaxID=1129897 RepID=I4EEY6_9BACT|nr:DUF1326 domain-containing protein [Nitrolancea hollandica]CCF83248.1 hypothetical protein NITHO_210004 [Nitrolancea hollandica Lb]